MAFQVTQCPGCESTFNTNARILESAAGKVRCGACLKVFNAADYFLHPEDTHEDDDASVFVGSNPGDYFDPTQFITRSALTAPDTATEPFSAASSRTESEDDFSVDTQAIFATAGSSDISDQEASDDSLLAEPFVKPGAAPVSVAATDTVTTPVAQPGTRTGSAVKIYDPVLATSLAPAADSPDRLKATLPEAVDAASASLPKEETLAAESGANTWHDDQEEVREEGQKTDRDEDWATKETEDAESLGFFSAVADAMDEEYLDTVSTQEADLPDALPVAAAENVEKTGQAGEDQDTRPVESTQTPSVDPQWQPTPPARQPAPEDIRIHASFSLYHYPPSSPPEPEVAPEPAETAEETPSKQAESAPLTETTETEYAPDPTQSEHDLAADNSLEIDAATAAARAAAETETENATGDHAAPEATAAESNEAASTGSHAISSAMDSVDQEDVELIDLDVFEMSDADDVAAFPAHDENQFVEKQAVDETATEHTDTDDVNVDAAMDPESLAAEDDSTPTDAGIAAEIVEEQNSPAVVESVPLTALNESVSSEADAPTVVAEQHPADDIDTDTSATITDETEPSTEEIRARALRTIFRDEDALEELPVETRSALSRNLPPVEFLSGKEGRWGRRILLSMAFLLLSAALVAQFLWQRMPVYARTAEYRPFYETVCNALPVTCDLPVYTQISAIRSDNLVVRSHQTADNALTVSLSFRNTAEFPQPFPVLVLSFNSASNAIIALREFSPQEYLAPDLQSVQLMPVMSPVQVELDVIDPGPDAVNYTVAFRRP